ncbi:hypothetical protein [Flavimarina sp. Hel_I_48]|uniref:hypothetical protein n=1 Tax=Flavimarina sp. Hel_I_48 TaxID=1392488 RepID=UPI0004DF26E2|nr:hypothetical protein [Flavimarina sp. Hel_I_48]
MEKENIEDWFNGQKEDCWDLADPKNGHRERFMTKLGQKTDENRTISMRFWWKPLAVAASLVFIVMLSLIKNNSATSKELAAVSPQMEETQDFFSAAIASELYKVKERRSPENKKLIDDALTQLNTLELNYTQLKKDLSESGEDKRVIYAMITNFQMRIDLLKEVMIQLDEKEHLKNKKDEKQLF